MPGRTKQPTIKEALTMPNGTTKLRDHAQTVLEEQQRQARAADADAALQENNEAAEAGPIAAQTESDLYGEYLTDPTGMRVDQSLVMPALLPVPRSQAVDWIMRNVVAHGAGTHICVGRVVGRALRAEWRETEWQGKTLRSVLLTGEFRMQSTVTDLVRQHADLWLPTGYAKQIEAALALDPDSRPMFDVDIGLEATGRTIPYAWTVISHLRQRSSSALERLWAARTVQPGLLTGPAATSPQHAA
jgi:hypothetical protein